MKSLLLIASFLLANVASASCIGEAQFIAKVGQISKKTMYDCVVKLDETSVTHYRESIVCPLDLSEVLETGISVGLINGHDCAYSTGDQISGVVVKKDDGTLILD